VHFKSRDLTTLHRMGQFWHVYVNDSFSLNRQISNLISRPNASFMTTRSVIIAQDEKETWTVHRFYPPGEEPILDPLETVYYTLNTRDIKIDEVLVNGTWQPNFNVAKEYRKGNVFIAGDACHQWIPTGGYGASSTLSMLLSLEYSTGTNNFSPAGFGDAYDLSWKLALT
jgi:FAD-dependent monooxygenase